MAMLAQQRGQSTIEFMLMMVIILFMLLAFVNLSFFASDLLLARFASFQAARGYLCRDSGWADNAAHVRQMMITAEGDMAASGLGDGAGIKVDLRETVDLGLLFSGKTSVERQAKLGKEPDLWGDNQCESSPQF